MRRFHLAVCALLIWSGDVACSQQHTTVFPSSLVGAWQEQNGDRLINIEAHRMIELDGSNLTVRGLIRRDGDSLVLRKMGFRQTWTAVLADGQLKLEPTNKDKDKGGTFRHLDRVPPQVKLDPLPVASRIHLPGRKILALQTEIKNRFEEEQALLKDRNRPRDKITEVQRENLAYLRQLLKETGWVDARRFGAKTSVYAVIMAKHTHDLRLMMTMLPYAERDLRSSGDGQTYAVLFDALQLQLGQKQLYGTQVAKDDEGKPFVLPMQESKDKVNLRLTRMGLPNLDEYLDKVSEAFYPGQRIACCRQDG